jgi:hypothetical protein
MRTVQVRMRAGFSGVTPGATAAALGDSPAAGYALRRPADTHAPVTATASTAPLALPLTDGFHV